MLKGLITGIVLTVLVIVLAGYLMLRMGAIPANADAKPPKFERWAARMSLHATLARSAPRTDDPMPATDDNLIAGVKLYGENCAVCHGDSNAKPSNVARGLYQKPPQLAKDGVEDDPPGVTYWKIAHGIRWTGMPAFGKSLHESQLWQLTLFLKNMDHLPPAPHKAWRQLKA